MAYFNNAATTYPKPDCVYDFMNDFYRTNPNSLGRGTANAATNTDFMVKETRELVKEVLNCNNKEVIFSPSATIALNIIIQGLIKKGVVNVYITPFEHNAVTRILNNYSSKKIINVYELYVSDELTYDLERIKYQFDNNSPDLVITSHASNVIGVVAPVESIFTLSKKYDSITLVDMAQTAGLVELNLNSDIYDFAVFAGHKTLYGPTGISGFVMKRGFDLPSVFFGGTGFDSANQNMPDNIPERFEFGTQDILAIAGLNASLKWIKNVSISEIRNKEIENRSKLVSLLEKYWFVNIIGNNINIESVGIVSIIIDGISSDSAGTIFEKSGISVRSGLQCAPLAHKFLNTFPAGTIRLSVSYFTTDDDFSALEKTLDYIEQNI